MEVGATMNKEDRCGTHDNLRPCAHCKLDDRLSRAEREARNQVYELEMIAKTYRNQRDRATKQVGVLALRIAELEERLAK